MKSRRRLLVALGVAPLWAALPALAQQPGKVWRIGFLALRRVASLDADTIYRGFPQAMRELGYVEGKNLVIELRHADGRVERLPALAAELVQLKMDVIVAAGAIATSAAQKATATIPIVMGIVNDPVGSGLINTLARPGGNITGVTSVNVELSSKNLEILLSMVPRLSRVAVLVYPANPDASLFLRNVQAAAQRVRVKVLPVEARDTQEIENAFSMMAKQKVGGVIGTGNPFFTQQIHQIAELANKYRIPAIFAIRDFAIAGGLISFGPDLADQYRRVATYVDKILKGAKPADLPVEQPMKLELLINRKTAKALGLTIPQELLLRADEVIE